MGAFGGSFEAVNLGMSTRTTDDPPLLAWYNTCIPTSMQVRMHVGVGQSAGRSTTSATADRILPRDEQGLH